MTLGAQEVCERPLLPLSVNRVVRIHLGYWPGEVEPFEGLAPAVVLELMTVFDRLRDQASILIVEHNLDVVLALADRVFALERGAVFHDGPAAPLLTDLDYRKKILWL